MPKPSEFSSTDPVAGTEWVIIEKDGTTYKVALSRIKEYADNLVPPANFDFDLPLDPPLPPAAGSRAHFSGLLFSTQAQAGITKIFDTSPEYPAKPNDIHSEYVGIGDYPKNSDAFPTAVEYTFDGIAIDAGVRCKIYSGENFTGSVVLDVTGPKIITNKRWNEPPYNQLTHPASYNYQFIYTLLWDDTALDDTETGHTGATLSSLFPVASRIWSSTDMHSWSYGSLKLRQVQ